MHVHHIVVDLSSLPFLGLGVLATYCLSASASASAFVSFAVVLGSLLLSVSD